MHNEFNWKVLQDWNNFLFYCMFIYVLRFVQTFLNFFNKFIFIGLLEKFY